MCFRWMRIAVALLLAAPLALAACDDAAGGGCRTNDDCPGGMCVSGECQDLGGDPGGCAGGCAYGERCVSGRCVFGPGCAGDADCTEAAGGRCVGGECLYDEPEGCRADADCPTGRCDTASGRCVTDGATCAGDGECDDGDPCTDDRCEAGGACSHTPRADCCRADAECDDGDPATADVCQEGRCANRAACSVSADCDDDESCTVDMCLAGACENDWVEGCCHTDADCNDGNPGTVDRCGEGSCRYTDRPGYCSTDSACDDGDPCTTDRCDESGTCRNEATGSCCRGSGDCDDGDPCTLDLCVEQTCRHEETAGCCRADAECDDGDPCTTDSCDDAVCAHRAVPGCCATAADCVDGDPCTTDACVGGRCDNARVAGCCTASAECDDGDDCTADVCSANRCTFEAIADCCHVAADCGDGDRCTADSCVDGRCEHVALPGCCSSDADCNDDIPRTVDTCNAQGQCEHTWRSTCEVDEDCGDGNPCTEDVCQGGTCAHGPRIEPWCRCLTDGDCDGKGGVCSLLDAGSEGVLGYCVVPAGDRPGGSPCDPSASRPQCESGLCLEVSGTPICYGACGGDADCAGETTCGTLSIPGAQGAPVNEVAACVPPLLACADDASCPEGMICLPYTTDDAPAEVRQGCFYPEPGEGAIGDACDADADCQSGTCIPDATQGGVCYGVCDDDGDCGEGQRCYPDFLSMTLDMGTPGVPGDDVSVPIPACLWDEGTLAPCVDDAVCPADQYCRPYTLNSAPDELVFGCAYPQGAGTGRTGEGCTSDAECMSGFCLPDAARGGVCFGMCDADADCGEGQRCYPDFVSMTLDMNTADPADDIDVNLPSCQWDEGSFAPCALETQCAPEEVCLPLLNETNDGFAPLCTLPDPSLLGPGETCLSHDQCQTGFCLSGDTRSLCLMFCGTTSDCPNGTCDQVEFEYESASFSAWVCAN